MIATDTDWSTSRFTIDDTDVENHRQPLFTVRSLLEPEELQIDQLKRDQQRLDVRPGARLSRSSHRQTEAALHPARSEPEFRHTPARLFHPAT